jgi:hypothetical protein
VVDRLSDVAGPLRPRERFESYLTAYPLPSEEHFVLARTWQDLTVARAGCVRTLSLIIPMNDWAEAEGLSGYLDLVGVGPLPDEGHATQVVARTMQAEPLPRVPGAGSELLEALFLEEARSVVVLDADDPNLIATRLLTSLWPSLRRQFAISTFALSPRKVAGRDFDLMFAPRDARARFADWSGRRVDGRSSQSSRHPWTRALVSRVFEQPYPRLLSPTEIELVGGREHGVADASALRIALLWAELVAKLHTTPSAALGLLDIANSGKVRNPGALRAIEPSLADAAQHAAATLPEADAWSFLGAIARKLLGLSMPTCQAAVAEAVEQLAARAPEGAVAFLSQEDPRGVVADLLPRIASGMGGRFTDRSERALLNADPVVLGMLVAHGDGRLMARITGDRPLVDRLERVLPLLDATTLDFVALKLLPLLTEDWQIPAAEPLIARLDAGQLAVQLHHLAETNDFRSVQLSSLVFHKLMSVTSREHVRQALLSLPPTKRRDEMIARTLFPDAKDVWWVVEGDAFDRTKSTAMLLELLGRTNEEQLAAMLVDQRAGAYVLETLQTGAPQRLLLILSGDVLPVETFVRIVRRVFSDLDAGAALKLATHALRRCLPCRFGDREVAFLVSMMGAIGDKLDGAGSARIGLARGVEAALAGRNLIAFHKATPSARRRIVCAIGEIAQVLRDRRRFDLDAAAGKACAALMFEAESMAPRALLLAAGHLLPMLLRSRHQPVSPMIVAAFPPIHRELAEADDIPDLFKFIPFLDWDRCKAARHELVDAFMSSTWPPGDLALTACRANEIDRILRRTAKQRGGAEYIARIAAEAGTLPAGCREPIEKAIELLGSSSLLNYD